MNNPVLISDSFERAAHGLTTALDRFGGNCSISHEVEIFERSVEHFRVSVDKLATILGMQAENDQRKALGQSMAYTESDFASA